MSTISCVVIFALIAGTSKGEEAIFSGTREKVLPSFLRIKTFPVFSASSSVNLFCLNIAEKALQISQGIDPGPISVFPVSQSRLF